MFEPQGKKYKALAGDASSRRYWRVKNSNQILCHEPNSVTQNEFLTISKLFQKAAIAAPRVLSIDKINQTYLQDDLGDTTLLVDLVRNSSEELNRYKQVIDELLKIQTLHMNSELEIPSFVKQRFFDKEKFDYEVDMTLNYFGSQLLGIDNKDSSLVKTKESFDKIIKKLCLVNHVFVHRDFHSRNIMIKDRNIFIIDFQDARMGTPYYDLVSLLDDCYYQIESNNKENLLKYYYNKAMSLNIIDVSYEEFLDNYYLMTLQRVFKAIGSFAYIYIEKKNPRYLKYIGYSVEKLRTISLLNPMGLDLEFKILEDYYAN